MPVHSPHYLWHFKCSYSTPYRGRKNTTFSFNENKPKTLVSLLDYVTSCNKDLLENCSFFSAL